MSNAALAIAPELTPSTTAFDAVEGVSYVTRFETSRFGAHDGVIVAIDARGVESTVLDGFHKPVGIALLGRILVVADARARAVFRVSLVAGRAVSRLQLAALPDRPELVSACGDDSVQVTSCDATGQISAVRRIWLDGRVELISETTTPA
jgi:hypothetical protein